MSKFVHELYDGLTSFASALAPAAIGAAIAQAWQGSMSWSQRLLQWAVGICVSYYVTMGVSAGLHLNPFCSQAIGFVIAMVAYRAAPKFIEAAAAAAAALPGRLLERFGLAGKDEA